MKVIIEIPEEEYTRWITDGEIDALIVRDALRNGIPLPKGHGRLIDADKIEFEYYYGEWFITEAAIDHQPTVIEADAESERK